MTIPNWYELLLLGAAAWRIFQLISEDAILDRPRRWVLRLGSEWEKEGDPTPPGFRDTWALFLTCPYCAGFWIAVLWWGAFQITEKWTLVFAVPFVLSALVVGGAKILSVDEEPDDE